MDLKGKRVIIIGGSSGIGLAVAEAAADAGASLVIASRSAGKLDSIRERLGSAVQTFALDAVDENAVIQFFQQVGMLDHLVTSISASSPGLLVGGDSAALRHAFETKFWGQYYAAVHAAPYLKPEGSITLFSGISSRRAFPGMTSISPQNAAVEALGRSLALELAPRRVNVISPGLIDTPLWEKMGEQERHEMFARITAGIPAGRVGAPEDCASAVLFAMTNRFISGAVIDVDGGMLAA